MAKKKAEGKNGKEQVNKMELVRQTLATLGNDATGGQIAKHLKETASVEMSPNMASTYKGSILKKLGKSGRRRGRKRGRPAGESAPTSKPSGDAVSMKDLRTLHDMAQRVGMSRLRELLELVH